MYRGLIVYGETNLSTEQPSAGQDARFSCAHGDQEWPARDQAAPRQRQKAAHAGALLEPLFSALNDAPVKVSHALPKRCRLRTRQEFQRIYAEGQRYDGRLLAAFLRRNDLREHRFGVTASSKAVGGSVGRNRAKRLLRELFRRSAAELNGLQRKYDWVLNARRSLLISTEELRFREFRNIIAQVAQAERRGV